jgi:hypothetical protein
MSLEIQECCPKTRGFSSATIFCPRSCNGFDPKPLRYHFVTYGVGGLLVTGTKLLAQVPMPVDDIEDIIEPESPVPTGSMTDALELKDAPLWTGWYWIGGGILLVILALVFLLTRKRRKIQKESVPRIPPHEYALDTLREIWRREKEMEDKVYASGLSDVLRRYIEEAFALRAPERTTEEFFEEASQHADLKGDFAGRLEEFLSLIDLVKFARMPLVKEKREELYQAGVQFIEESHQFLVLKISPELSVSAQEKNDFEK